MTTSRRQVVGADAIGRAWAASPWLLGAGLAFLPMAAFAALGLLLDGRLIAGSPAWLKPFKFAVSSSAYCLTLAWIVAGLMEPSRPLRRAGTVVAAILLLEVGIVALQAARGTTSHFNVATPVDRTLFAIMGVSIAILLGASITIAIYLWRATFADRAWGLAVQLGMTVTVLGSTTGGLMLRPTAEQLAAAAGKGAMPIVGSHTVGPADGAAGMPLTGWSRTRGDLRVPHFVGLHALQAIPILAWLVGRTLQSRSTRRRVGLVVVIATSYTALIGLLAAQALAGRPVTQLDAPSLGALLAWAGLTLGALMLMTAQGRSRAADFSLALEG